MLSEIEQFQKWLRRRAPQSSTHVHYTSDLEMFFSYCAKPIAEVTMQDVDAYIEGCQEKGHAIATINRRIAALCSFYRYLAMMSDDAPSNPVRSRRHFIRQGKRLPRDVKDEDLARLFTVIDSRRDRAMFLLMLRCGLRVGEVRNLSLNDLYLYSVSGSLPRLWLHGKGDKERVVYLSSQAMNALEAWLEIRPNGTEQAVFVNRSGNRLTVTGIQLQLAMYCQRAEVWITCNQLRHTFGRHLVKDPSPRSKNSWVMLASARRRRTCISRINTCKQVTKPQWNRSWSVYRWRSVCHDAQHRTTPPSFQEHHTQ